MSDKAQLERSTFRLEVVKVLLEILLAIAAACWAAYLTFSIDGRLRDLETEETAANVEGRPLATLAPLDVRFECGGPMPIATVAAGLTVTNAGLRRVFLRSVDFELLAGTEATPSPGAPTFFNGPGAAGAITWTSVHRATFACERGDGMSECTNGTGPLSHEDTGGSTALWATSAPDTTAHLAVRVVVSWCELDDADPDHAICTERSSVPLSDAHGDHDAPLDLIVVGMIRLLPPAQRCAL